MMKRIGTVLAALLVATLGIVALPAPEAVAAPYDDPYTQEGSGIVNGREWRTTCAMYSTTVKRCRAEIKATQVRLVGGRYVEVNDFVFNNLTYLPSPRAQWAGNPLGGNGKVGAVESWQAPDGRRWRVECDTAASGRNGCRAFVLSTIYAIKTMTPRTYETRQEWVFNNIVQFTVPTPPAAPVFCDNAPLPAGFALTREGRPHAVKTPYEPATLYNPTSISNFIRSAITRHNNPVGNTAAQKSTYQAGQKCLALLGADHLMAGSETTKTPEGQTARWFPYMFTFSANPTMADLKGPWHSGLAQGGVLTTFIQLANLTGDRAKWLGYGAETFRSFEVPISEPGGILHRNAEHDFLWFEEYPTKPLPTTVLNGHLEAVIGLNLWHRRMVADGANAVTDPAEVKALVDEAMQTLEPMLALHEVDIDGGLLTSYDAVRGHDVAPLRVAGTNARVTAELNGQRVTLPAVLPGWERNTFTSNGAFSLTPEPGADPSMPKDWARFGSASNVVWRGDYMDVTSNGSGWQGFQQEVPASWLTAVAGKDMTLTMRAAVTYPANAAGASGRVAVFNDCPSGRTLNYENVLRGSGEWTNFTFGFKAPPAGCGMLVQFMISPWQNSGTNFKVDDAHLSSAQPVGSALTPKYDLLVYNTRVNKLTLTGSGSGTVQAHYNGRWQDIKQVNLSGQRQDVVIPERYTGRNIHLGYHETHIRELMSLYSAFRPAQGEHPYAFLLKYAQRWAPMAPSVHHTVPKTPVPTARGISPMGGEPMVIGGDTVELPPIVDQFTGLPYEELEHLDELQEPAS